MTAVLVVAICGTVLAVAVIAGLCVKLRRVQRDLEEAQALLDANDWSLGGSSVRARVWGPHE